MKPGDFTRGISKLERRDQIRSLPPTQLEAAALLHVSPKTISRWAREGKLGHVVTLGGHRRFSRDDIETLAERMVISEEM